MTPWEQNWQKLFKPLYVGAPLTVSLRRHPHPLQHPSSYISPGTLTLTKADGAILDPDLHCAK